MKNKGLVAVVSSIILACALIVSSLIISYKFNQDERGMMTLKEAAHYMSMTEKEFEHTIEEQDVLKGELMGRATYDEGYFIPYYRYGEYYFSKKELDKWIDFNMNHRFPDIE